MVRLDIGAVRLEKNDEDDTYDLRLGFEFEATARKMLDDIEYYKWCDIIEVEEHFDSRDHDVDRCTGSEAPSEYGCEHADR